MNLPQEDHLPSSPPRNIRVLITWTSLVTLPVKPWDKLVDWITADTTGIEPVWFSGATPDIYRDQWPHLAAPVSKNNRGHRWALPIIIGTIDLSVNPPAAGLYQLSYVSSPDSYRDKSKKPRVIYPGLSIYNESNSMNAYNFPGLPNSQSSP